LLDKLPWREGEGAGGARQMSPQHTFANLDLFPFQRAPEHLSHCHWSNALLWILLPLLHTSAYRRKFRSQTSDNVDKWKSRGGKSQRREQQQKEDQRREDAGARKGRKVAIHGVFTMVCGSGESKSRLAKVAGAGPSGQMRDENCTPLWREAHFEVKMYKTPHSRTTFGN